MPFRFPTSLILFKSSISTFIGLKDAALYTSQFFILLYENLFQNIFLLFYYLCGLNEPCKYIIRISSFTVSKTFFESINNRILSSLVLISFLNPKCITPLYSSKLLNILMYRIHRNIFSKWLMMLIERGSLQLVALFL